MIIRDLEKKVNQTLSKSDESVNVKIKKVIASLEGELDHIKMNRPTHEKVVQLVNQAFQAATASSGKTVEKIIVNPNITIEKITRRIMNQVQDLFQDNPNSQSELSQKALEGALLQINDTINSLLENSNISEGSNFYKFSLLDIILSSTAVVLAFIAVTNSACLAVLRKKLRKARAQSFNDLELTPIVKKGIKFGKDKVREYNDYSSIDTLPSPEPTFRKTYRK